MKRNALILLSVLLLFLARSPLLAATASVLEAPMQWGAHVARLLRDLADLPHLRNQNDRLRATVAQLTQQLTQWQEAAQENVRLQRLLDLPPPPGVRWVAARVVGVSPAPGSRAVMLDKGLREGLRAETPVVTPEGLVGKVLQVNAHTSLVLLMTDANFRAACLIERSRETAVLAGSLDGRLWVQLLPAGADVAVGDVVLTSGLGDVFPKGLRIGTVRRVGPDSTRLYQLVEVIPAAPMNRLEEVLCEATAP